MMARPRVILASEDAEAAVNMIGALNPKRYRVEHIFDLSEAMLRAELVLAHTLVVHVPQNDEATLKRCAGRSERVSLVLVSSAPEVEMFAVESGARFVSDPFGTDEFKRAVFRAVAAAHDRRGHSHTRLKVPEESTPKQRVVLLTADAVHGSVMAAVIHRELDVVCVATDTAHNALRLLDDRVDCLVADPELLMTDIDGVTIARRLAREGVPVIPLATAAEIDVSTAGQVAWDIVPQVRRSLMARCRAAAS